MIKCMIVDDEQAGIDVLTDHIQKTPDLEIVATFLDSVKALDSLREGTVDLIFLDIDMPRFSGLDFVEALQAKKQKLPYIIFTTGHDSYAVQGFEQGITDFLLKPITFKRFKIAIDRLLSKHLSAVAAAPAPSFFFVESEGKKVKIDFEDILYLEAAGNYVKLITLKGNHMLYASMSSIQAQLPESGFSRIHNSFIIAIPHIQSVTRNEVVLLVDKKAKPMPVGVTYREALFKKLKIQ
jgi:two-component system LytT family response regulator